MNNSRPETHETAYDTRTPAAETVSLTALAALPAKLSREGFQGGFIFKVISLYFAQKTSQQRTPFTHLPSEVPSVTKAAHE